MCGFRGQAGAGAQPQAENLPSPACMQAKPCETEAPTDTRLWVGGLPPDVTAEELGRRFHPFGIVLDVEVIRGTRNSSSCRGFGYVTLQIRAKDLANCLKAHPASHSTET